MLKFASLNRIALTGTLLAAAGLAGGCSSIDRLSQIGESPKLTAIDNPTTQPGYKPVQMPMPKPETVSYNANSLWRNGSRAFFRDQRASRVTGVGGILVCPPEISGLRQAKPAGGTGAEDDGLGAYHQEFCVTRIDGDGAGNLTVAPGQ